MDRNDLLAEADDLAELILHTPELAAYRDAQAAMERNREAVHLLRKFHELREQVAEFQARRVPPMHYSYLLKETDEVLQKMEEIPEIKAYEQAQKELEELLTAVTDRLSSAVQVRDADGLAHSSHVDT